MYTNIIFTVVSLIAGAHLVASQEVNVTVKGFKDTACAEFPIATALLDDPDANNCQDFITGFEGVEVEFGDSTCSVNLFSETVCDGDILATIVVDSDTFGTCNAITGGGAFSAQLVGC